MVSVHAKKTVLANTAKRVPQKMNVVERRESLMYVWGIAKVQEAMKNVPK